MRPQFTWACYATAIAYVGIALALDNLWLETEVDTPYWVALRWLIAPFGVALYLAWWRLDPAFVHTRRVWWRHLLLWFWAGLAALLSGGHVSAANHLLGAAAPAVVYGEVRRLGHLSGRFGPRQHLVTLRLSDGSSVRLSIPLAEHETLNVGETYRREMLCGAFGILYRVK